MKNEKNPGIPEKIVAGAVAGGLTALATTDPILAGIVSTTTTVLGEGIAAKVRDAFRGRFEKWWRAVCTDPTMSPEAVRDRIEADLTAEHAVLILQSYRTLEAVIDEAVIPCLGALAQEYLAPGYKPDRFFRSASAMLVDCDANDLLALARTLAAARNFSETWRIRIASIRVGESHYVLVCGVRESGEIVKADADRATSPPVADADRVVYLLSSSGLGHSQSVADGEAVDLTPQTCARLSRILGSADSAEEDTSDVP